MIQQLAARSALAAGNHALALQRYQAGSTAHPGYQPLQYGYISALLAARRSTTRSPRSTGSWRSTRSTAACGVWPPRRMPNWATGC
jgi:hypothetical protein